jgi:hypothetical protein
MNRSNPRFIICACLLSGVFAIFCGTVVRFPAGGGIYIRGPLDFIVEANFGDRNPIDNTCRLSKEKSTGTSGKGVMHGSPHPLNEKRPDS